MAWQMKITVLTDREVDSEGNTIDLAAQGRFSLRAEYFDDADPTTILHEHGFDYRYPQTWEQTLELMKETGRVVRETRKLVADHQRDVGTAIAID